MNFSYRKGWKDLSSGLTKSSLWWALSYQDIKQRYRRSTIGPFWITISTGIFVAAMGPLYGALLGQDTSSYVQYLAVSFILWIFISSTINESCTVFIGAEGMIKQIELPVSIHIFRLLSKNVLILGHNAVVIAVVLIFYPPISFSDVWLLPLGLLLLFINLFWISLLLALFSTRFRDVPQIVASLMQIFFFLSPILWRPEMLGPRNHFLADYNPLYHFIEIVRSPLLGTPTNLLNWLVSTITALTGCALTFILFSRFRSRIAYWL
jgi:ABC-type polysaccharide/polyol phosphate export permease